MISPTLLNILQCTGHKEERLVGEAFFLWKFHHGKYFIPDSIGLCYLQRERSRIPPAEVSNSWNIISHSNPGLLHSLFEPACWLRVFIYIIHCAKYVIFRKPSRVTGEVAHRRQIDQRSAQHECIVTSRCHCHRLMAFELQFKQACWVPM